jgi:hypothetical protein
VKQGGASCIAWARRKTGAPKLSAALIFAHNLLFLKVFASSPLRGSVLWLLSFNQEKESNVVF